MIWFKKHSVMFSCWEKSPVSPEEVFLLLGDFRKRVSVTQLPQLLRVAVCQRVISGHTIALKHNRYKTRLLHLPTFNVHVLSHTAEQLRPRVTFSVSEVIVFRATHVI